VKPTLRLLFETAADDSCQQRRHVGHDRPKRGWFALEDRAAEIGSRSGSERAPSRKHLVEQRAERKQVGAMIPLRAPDLLRREVTQNVWRKARRRRFDGRRSASALGINITTRGTAGRRRREAAHVCPIIRRDEDVLRRQVAMHDTLLM